MFFRQLPYRPIENKDAVILDGSVVDVPFEGDVCLRGKGLIQSKEFMGCIALGGYFELEDGTQFSVLTHQSANDSENNLARFDKNYTKIVKEGKISRGILYIFHLDIPETVGAMYLRLPYTQSFSSNYESIIKRVTYFLSRYGYEIISVPYSIKSQYTNDKSGTVFINSETMHYGTNFVSSKISSHLKSTIRSAL